MNIQEIMKAAQNMQARLAEAQAKLDTVEVEGQFAPHPAERRQHLRPPEIAGGFVSGRRGRAGIRRRTPAQTASRTGWPRGRHWLRGQGERQSAGSINDRGSFSALPAPRVNTYTAETDRQWRASIRLRRAIQDRGTRPRRSGRGACGLRPAYRPGRARRPVRRPPSAPRS